MFFSCGHDGTVKQWDADNFQRIVTLEGHSGIVRWELGNEKGNNFETIENIWRDRDKYISINCQGKLNCDMKKDRKKVVTLSLQERKLIS